QPLTVFELTQFIGDADQHIGIRSDAEPAAGVKKLARRKNAVAEARFRNRTESGNRAALRQRYGFLGRHVGRMDETAALIERRTFEQPLDRPPAGPGNA